jgi:hypothetical protein
MVANGLHARTVTNGPGPRPIRPRGRLPPPVTLGSKAQVEVGLPSLRDRRLGRSGLYNQLKPWAPIRPRFDPAVGRHRVADEGRAPPRECCERQSAMAL